MTAAASAAVTARPAADHWPRPDGTPVDCREKLKVLRENQAELEQVVRDWFEDGVLMGVDAGAMRRLLGAMADGLADPRPGGDAP